MEKVTHRNVGTAWTRAPWRTIIDLVLESCRRDPGSPCLIFEDGLVLSRAELLNRVEQFAGYLRPRVDPGDRIAIMLGNRAEFLIAWLAIAALRGTQVSVNPAFGEHDAQHVFGDSGSVLAIVGEGSRGLMGRVQPLLRGLREVLFVGEPEPDGLATYTSNAKPCSLADIACERDDIINIFYTSGTTGPPKGCMVDHNWWLRALDVSLRLDPLGSQDRILCCLQFFYNDAPLIFLSALACGGAMITMRKFSVSRFWDVVRRNDVTRVIGIASIPILLLKAPPDPLDREHKVVLGLQLAIPPHLHKEMNERWGFPWIDAYGITEGGIIARVPRHLADEMVGSGSCGVRAPEVDLRLIDGDGKDVPPGGVGEAIVRAPGMMRGYLNRPEATAEVMRDGWLHTGDLLREDELGFLYFIGRKKDIVRRSGENIAAAEVEDVLRAHPRVLDAAVVAVPDDLRGEEVKAFLLLREGESRETCTPEDVVAFCASRLAKYKVPRYIEYRSEDFPRTPSMRVRKEDLLREREDRIATVWDREASMDRGR